MTENRRRDPRRDLCVVGRLRMTEGEQAHAGPEDGAGLECLVWDLSAGGAMIECERDDLPDRFSLTVDGVLPERRCLVVRREMRRFAVTFDPGDEAG